MDNNIQWVDKYKPKNVSDIIGNSDAVNTITEWLKVFKNPTTAYKGFKNGLLISGPPGIGKTSTAHVLLNEYGYDVVEFNASELRTSKEICDKLDNILSGKSIKTMFIPNSKTGIIMDEIDGIESKKEYSSNDIITYLNFSENEYNKMVKIDNKAEKKTTSKKKKQAPVLITSKNPEEFKNKRCFNGVWVNKNPIICICNFTNKNITSLIKNAVHVKFNLPTDYDIFTLLKRINDSEKLGISEPILNLIVPHCQYDHRRTIYIMETLAIHIRNNNNQPINSNSIIKLINNLGSKDIDVDIITAVDNTFNRFDLDYDELLINYEADANFVPFIIHENFINFIDKNTNNTFNEKIDLCLEYYDNLTNSQLFKNDFFGNWEYSDYIGIFSCVVPNYIIKKSRLKNTLIYTKYEKSALISKYNYRFYNLKSINTISKKMNIDITNFQSLSGLVVHSIFIETEFLPQVMQLFANYKMTFKNLEKTMKLSLFFDDYEKLYTKKFQKNLLAEYSKYYTGDSSDEDND